MKTSISITPLIEPNALLMYMFRMVAKHNAGHGTLSPLSISEFIHKKNEEKSTNGSDGELVGDGVLHTNIDFVLDVVTIFRNNVPIMTLSYQNILGNFPSSPNAKIKENG